MFYFQILDYSLPDDSPKRCGFMIPKYITIHETSLGTEETPKDKDFYYYHQLLLTTQSTIGYHYLIEARKYDAKKNRGFIPTVYQLIEPTVATDHTGNKVGNSESIGIERLVNEDTDFEMAIKLQAFFTSRLMKQFNIPIENVVPHKHWNGKECPSRLLAGMNGGWDGFIKKVKKYSLE